MSTETCARLALKELNLLDEGSKEMVKDQKMTKKNSKLSVGSCKPAAKKKNKKVMMRMGKEYVEYLEKHPPPPPSKPIKSIDRLLSALQDSFIAREKAALEEHERIIKQYKEQGYAEQEVEVSDDEDL